MSEPGIRPFSNGSQFDTWEAANCARCTKNWHAGDDGNPTTPCDIANALLFAFWDDGTVSIEIAQRMGKLNGRLNWPCGEVEWTAAWKDEFCLTHAEAEECAEWAAKKVPVSP